MSKVKYLMNGELVSMRETRRAHRAFFAQRTLPGFELWLERIFYLPKMAGKKVGWRLLGAAVNKSVALRVAFFNHREADDCSSRMSDHPHASVI